MEVMPIGEDVLLGTTIGAYRVARLLGIGGMGRVYKGVHPTIGSRVAIKVLSRECSDRRDLVERFFSEAKAVNLIRHESIVNVLDLAMLPDGRPYIIMEYLDGAPLAAIVEHAVAAGTPLPLGGLARLTVEVLDALGAAHAKGIVHRDLKPDNIFVTPSGRPKVLDFGIAKLNDMSTGSATRTGSLLGTPHYMSPEQAAGRPVDLRADIYAIGVILFECATGRKPFQADSLFELLRQHVEAPPPSPRALRPDLSPDLEHVILTALAKAPDQRFASAQAMSVALQHATAQLAPEQWTPITGSGTHRAQPSGAWQPTPPASWGSGAGHGPPSQPPVARDVQTRPARPSAQPPMGPQPVGQQPLGHQSTVSASAGQLQRAAPVRSKKGLWIGLGAVLLVGGGVAAAVLAGQGERPAPAASTEPAPPPAPVATPPAATADDDTPPAPAGKPDTADTPGTDPADSDAQADSLESQLDQAFEGLDQLDKVDLSSVPPAAKKQLDELKQLRKLPPAQRAKRLRELQQQMTKDLQQAADTLATDAPVEAPDDTPPPAAKPKAGPWVAGHQLAPFRIDPRRVDVSAFIRYAIAEAKKADPEAVLFRISIDGVAADGFANLELPSVASDTGSIELRFFSPSRAKPDPRTPIGVRSKQQLACEFRIEAEPDGVELREIGAAFGTCDKNIPIPAPRCSIADIWKKAIAKGAPAANAVANISYYASGVGSRSAFWWFDIGSGMDKVFSSRFPSC